MAVAMCASAATLSLQLEDARVAVDGYQVDCLRMRSRAKYLQDQVAELQEECLAKTRSTQLVDAEEEAVAELLQELEDYCRQPGRLHSCLPSVEGSWSTSAVQDLTLTYTSLPEEFRQEEPLHLPDQTLLLEKRQALSSQISELEELRWQVRQLKENLAIAFAGSDHPEDETQGDSDPVQSHLEHTIPLQRLGRKVEQLFYSSRNGGSGNSRLERLAPEHVATAVALVAAVTAASNVPIA
ncbi:unnamed protein product [Polarella glacialis]|uniref:Uncharacterized protein n=1 Tax=Polarella glacialis TaxID=89957 RepID=A0A813KV83_POLGL|nr:unnamed protein product [Polarella glacialis]